MNSIAKHLFVAAATAATFAGSTRAQEADADTWMPAMSTQTRAQVTAEPLQARADGRLPALALAYLPGVMPGVRAQTEVAQAARPVRRSEVCEHFPCLPKPVCDL